MVMEAKYKIRVSTGLVPLQACEGESIPGLWLPQASLGLLAIFSVSSLCEFLFVCKFSLFLRTPVTLD